MQGQKIVYLFQILRSLIRKTKRKNDGSLIIQNQTLILDKLLKCHYLISKVILKKQSKMEFLEIFLIRRDLEIEEAKRKLNLLVHIEVIQLLTILVQENERGIQQVKKILSLDYLKQVVRTEKNLGEIPFYVKRVYLRIFLNLYVSGEQNRKKFKEKDIIAFLENITFEQLKLYPIFLSGLVPKVVTDLEIIKENIEYINELVNETQQKF